MSPAGSSRYESMNVSSSQMNSSSLSENVGGATMSGGEAFYGSGWEPNPMVSLSQSGNFGGPSMVSHGDFRNSHYPSVMESQGIGGASHFSQYSSNQHFVELDPKLQCFGSGNFLGMVGSFVMPQSSQMVDGGFHPNYVQNQPEGSNEGVLANGAHSHEECQVSEEGNVGASPKGKRRKRVPDLFKNPEEEPRGNPSGDSSDAPKEHDEKKLKIGQTTAANSRGKQVAKAAKDGSQTGEASKEDYIHVRARRGQATNSHSLAERVRREKIRERMGLLQEIVPGCNKITGKAVMLDEIINYVQSLQQQVEFLSMKLATVNPELNADLDRLMSKDILHSRGGAAAFLGFEPAINSSHAYPPPGHFPQTPLDNELHNLLQMGYNSSSAIDSLGPNAGRMKS